MSNLKQCVLIFFIIVSSISIAKAQSQYGISAKTTYPIGKSFLRYGVTSYAMFEDNVKESRNYFHWRIQYLFPLSTSHHYALDDLERFDTNNESTYLNYHVRTSSLHLSAIGARHNFESSGNSRKFVGFGIGASIFMFHGEIDTQQDTYLQKYMTEGREVLFDVIVNPFAGVEFDLNNERKISLKLDMDFHFLRFGYLIASIGMPMNQDPLAMHYSPLQFGVSVSYSF
jgi:hypothetical protein